MALDLFCPATWEIHSVAARILKGERGITVEHAKNLGAWFKVDPKLFLKLK